MSSPRDKLQELLRELFQFGSADLDFGIYRVMNFRRDAIERFIQRDLIEAVLSHAPPGHLALPSMTLRFPCLQGSGAGLPVSPRE
jgi:adenine-specific DNA-methyltransferase